MKKIKEILKKFYINKIIYQIIGVVYNIILLIDIPIFISRNRKKIYCNKIIYPFWNWSFGHTVLGIDYASRLYYPNRITLIFIPHVRSNCNLAKCFQHNIDYVIYDCKFLPKYSIFEKNKYKILNAYLMLINIIYQEHTIIKQVSTYDTLSLAEAELKVGNEEKNQLLKTSDITGYIRLLNNKIGKEPMLPNQMSKLCEKIIVDKYESFFDKPFVTLSLRNKGIGGEYSDYARNCGPQENYINLIKKAVEYGYNVVGISENEHELFKEIEGYRYFECNDKEYKILNLYFLTKCDIFIGQQSGTHVLPNTCGIICLITDAFPLRIGTFASRDLILHKKYYKRDLRKYLNFKELFENYEEIVYGYTLQKNKIELIPNSSEEICMAFEEIMDIKNNRIKKSGDDIACEKKYKSILKNSMTIKYQNNNMTKIQMNDFK